MDLKRGIKVRRLFLFCNCNDNNKIEALELTKVIKCLEKVTGRVFTVLHCTKPFISSTLVCFVELRQTGTQVLDVSVQFSVPFRQHRGDPVGFMFALGIYYIYSPMRPVR